jgi:glycine/D-amino acid oxidase-like deaminating enzyme
VLDGYDELATWTVEDLLDGRPSTLGGTTPPAHAVVIGAGRHALACALSCARAGSDVTLLGRERPGFDASGLVRRAYVTRLERDGVRRLRGRPVALRAAGVEWAAEDGGTGLLEADGVVVAGTRSPVRVPGLERLGAALALVGDAREPRDIASATAEGRDAVDDFTRSLR